MICFTYGCVSHNQIIENYIRDDGIIDSLVSDKAELKITAKYTYIPIASCISAYSRKCLCDTALKFGWENILYFDTDSIFMIMNDHTLKVWSTINQEDFLGGWAIEDISDKGQFTSAKRYKLLTEEGEAVIKAGGINFNHYKQTAHQEEFERYIASGMTTKEALSMIKLPYEEVNIISSKWMVQRAYRVKGGTIIEFQEKKMDVQDKYIEIFKKNII